MNKRTLKEYLMITVGTIIIAPAVYFFMLPSIAIATYHKPYAAPRILSKIISIFIGKYIRLSSCCREKTQLAL